MTKSDVTKALKSVEDIYCGRIKVKTFNSHKKMPTGSRGWVDHVVMIRNKGLILIEVKIGQDKLSKEQILVKDILESINVHVSGVKYRQIASYDDVHMVLEEIAKEFLGGKK